MQEVTGKRSEVRVYTEAEIEKLPKDAIISTEEIAAYEVQEFAGKEPPEVGDESAFKQAHEAWEKAKADWDANQIKRRDEHEKAREGKKQVNVWVDVLFTRIARMDGKSVKIYHTLRGPLMGQVVSEDSVKAMVYSPCFLDPNIERGRVHYLPLAFAGRYFTVYRSTCLGESVPQEAEVMGYPHFVENNRKGDYKFRMRAAYHHIDADMPEGSQVVSADLSVREPLFGLVSTSDTRERKQVARARQLDAMQKQAQSAPASE